MLFGTDLLLLIAMFDGTAFILGVSEGASIFQAMPQAGNPMNFGPFPGAGPHRTPSAFAERVDEVVEHR